MMTTSINILAQRSSGVLLPVFSLPAPCGIGDLGHGAYHFINFLKRAGQSCWQILPLGPTSADLGHSPYMSASALAGNPLLISPELLVEQGLLQSHQLAYPDFSDYTIDYRRVQDHKHYLLSLAWDAFQGPAHAGLLDDFMVAQPWVQDFGLFMALKDWHNQAAWFQWPKPLRLREKDALAAAHKELQAEVRRYCFQQYLFFEQWGRLKGYSQERGIRLVGDLPIYVALDSVDVWVNQEIFALDAETGEATHIAGVPPDYFSETGQRWGNPLYNWSSADVKVRSRLYDWWELRLRQNFQLTDILRLDHFRGFESYWSIPAQEETAINGEWLPGPGLAFFREMEQRLGEMALIAEDLGVITPEVEALRDVLGLPGMKILLFAFDYLTDNSYLPYNCPANSVIYTGTHDNETAVGWFLNPDVEWAFKKQAKRFANKTDADPASFHTDLIYLAMAAQSNLAIFPMQDLLGFGNDCRMNTPGRGEGNWLWRCAPQYINDGLADWLHELTRFFGRLPSPPLQTESIDDEHPYS